MAVTDFASMQEYSKRAWAMDTWTKLRESSFIMQRVGTSNQSGIQKISELTALPSGNKCIINLLHDLVQDGVVGDQTLKGNEEAAQMSQIEIVIDQLRHGITNKGRMADQKAVLKIRFDAKDLISYWLADRLDQMAFLTMAGVDYSFKTDGSVRPGDPWSGLDFASAVTPPSDDRWFRWDSAGKQLAPGDTATVDAADTLSWRSLIELKAAARDRQLRPLTMKNGIRYYEVYCSDQAIKALQLDPEYHAALKEAMPRDPNNPIFQGAEVYYVDGLALYPYWHSFTNRNAATKWGSGGDVDGNRVTLMGAQGMAYGEIGSPGWEEEEDDYKARWGIGVDQILGFLKTQFPDPRTNMTKQDFGLLSMDVALKI